MRARSTRLVAVASHKPFLPPISNSQQIVRSLHASACCCSCRLRPTESCAAQVSSEIRSSWSKNDFDEHHVKFFDDYEHESDPGVSFNLTQDEMDCAMFPVWEQLHGKQKQSWEAVEDHAGDELYEETGEKQGEEEWNEWVNELQKPKVKRTPTKSAKRSKLSPARKIQPEEEPTPLKNSAPTTISEGPSQSNQPLPQPTIEPPALIKSTSVDITRSAVSPYRLPVPLPPSQFPNQPHESLLLSRNDWRLSSPLLPPQPTPRNGEMRSPPSLKYGVDNTRLGKNKLVGIGGEPARVGKFARGIQQDEQWGWKTRVPPSEKGEWLGADIHKRKLDRLLDLTAEADEKFYLESLRRLGTPEERERMGRTVQRATGQWLVGAEWADKVAKMTVEEKKEFEDENAQNSISVWKSAEGFDLSEHEGWKFPPNTILRFTPLVQNEMKYAPQASPSATPRYPQGTLLEVREGQLIVAIEAVETWRLGAEEYRIDIGLDSTAIRLQRIACKNFYFDPQRQIAYNQKNVLASQVAFAQGDSTILREWTLRGTELRQLIVPDLDQQPDILPELAEENLIQAEVKHLPDPVTELPIPPPPLPREQISLHPSNLFADNQLINSWIKRNQRENPIQIPGDPILKLNKSQTKAVAMALGEKLSLIQGPPGTGKSATIVSIIALLKLHFRVPQPILLAAPTHVSVDHLVSLLITAGLNPLRTGKSSKVRSELVPWTIEARREQHPLWTRLEKAREESETKRNEMQNIKDRADAAAGWTPTHQRDYDLAEAAYRKAWRKFVSLEQRLYSSLLATADVFCSTALGAGPSKVMSMIDFPIVFLDEAAMCTEPVTLIPIMKGAQHVCLIGDHKQLPAVVQSKTAVRERLHVSLFERLMAQQTVKSTLLNVQYRMHPAISAFPNQAFYHSSLQDSFSVQNRPDTPTSGYITSSQPCSFISHSFSESSYRQSSLNSGEIEIIINLIGNLLQKNPNLDAADIGIISPYYAQTRLLVGTFEPNGQAEEFLRPLLGNRRASQVSRVEINTVDGFQGREKRIIILSTVRSNSRGFIGFLTDERRLNVALTRAREILFVVGNEKTLSTARVRESIGDREKSRDSDSGIWRKYLNWMRNTGAILQWDHYLNESNAPRLALAGKNLLEDDVDAEEDANQPAYARMYM